MIWDFGDGQTGTGDDVMHMYQPGTYTVTATYNTDPGNPHSETFTIE